MGQAVHYGPLGDSEPLHAVILKKYAFHGGPQVVDVMYPYLVGGKDFLATPPDPSTRAGRLDLSLRLLIAVEMVPNDQKNLWNLHKIALLTRDVELKQPDVPRSPAVLARSVESMLADPNLDMLLRQTSDTLKAVQGDQEQRVAGRVSLRTARKWA